MEAKAKAKSKASHTERKRDNYVVKNHRRITTVNDGDNIVNSLTGENWKLSKPKQTD